MKKTLYTFAILALLLLSPLAVSAARFTLDLPETAARNQEITAQLFIHTGSESINAVSGSIVIPTNFTLKKILDGDTSILVWIDKPSFNETTRTLTFSGFTPGGIVGDRLLFSFITSAASAGTQTLNLSKFSALKNDGLGTPASSAAISAKITITSANGSTRVPVIDMLPPEPFTIELSSSPDLFTNQTFITFLAQDKGVGIDHYEYATRFWGSPEVGEYSRVESPFILPEGASRNNIFIKAVDKSGNERVVALAGPIHYVYVMVWGIIIVILIICVLYISRRFFH